MGYINNNETEFKKIKGHIARVSKQKNLVM